MKRIAVMVAFAFVGCIEPSATPTPTPSSHYHVIQSSQQ